jgi:Ca2+-binding RTX toxin-like protein
VSQTSFFRTRIGCFPDRRGAAHGHGAVAPSDVAAGFVDVDDTFDLQNSTACGVNGGDGNDIFRTSGDCSDSNFEGGYGVDDFTIGGTFVFSLVNGGDGNDVLTASGNWSNARVFAGFGNDRIDCRAVSGNIVLSGGDGADTLYAGSGSYELIGGADRDYMSGGFGDDYFWAVDDDAFNDILVGGDGNDYADIDAPGEWRILSMETVVEW